MGITQIIVPADAVVDDVAAKHCAGAAVVGSNASAHVSLLRETVFEEMALALEHRGMPPADMAERVREMLDVVGLGGCAEQHPARLSGGQTRKLVIGAAALAEPEVLVLAEPAAGLDAESRRDLAGVIRGLGRVVVVATRYWEELGGEVVGATSEPEVPALPAIRGCGESGAGLGLRRGTVLWLRGRNGSGKTTALRRLVDTGQVALALQNPEDQLLCAADIGKRVHPLDLPTSRLRVIQVEKIARAKKPVIAFDEPDSLLHPQHAPEVYRAIHGALRRGAAVIISCHDPAFLRPIAAWAPVEELGPDGLLDQVKDFL